VTYAQTRDSEQLRFLNGRISQFIQRYQSSNTPPQDRHTLILFPGGMGSQLLRAKTKFNPAGPVNQTFQYDKVWLTLKTFLGDALLLKMHVSAGGELRDLQDRVIIADDSAELFGIMPYSFFTLWCEFKNIDWFIYGWDWRLSIDDVAGFFVGSFLPAFRGAAQAATGNDPLQNLVLVGHSEGGMVLDLVLRTNNPILSTLKKAISVATPFYGYGGQLHRYFEGEPYFNYLDSIKVTKTIASFPGCYALLYMDLGTYLANQGALGAGPFPLTNYPSKDAVVVATNVDPYAPGPFRYPTNLGFSKSYLNAGRLTYTSLAAGPVGANANAFYNISGVQTANATVGGITWAKLATAYTPGSTPSPIVDDPIPVPGDGVQPAWTTRLLTLPASHWTSITDNIDHVFMMEHPKIQVAIGQLIGV
jgi:hypothetical protein